MDRSAKPTEDCLFIDPLKEGVLKLHNITSQGSNKKGGIISAYNVTDKNQKISFKPLDIPDIDENENYWIYDYIKKKVQSVKKNETFNEEIESGGFGWYIILPETDKSTCFGLIDKYVSFRAVENIIDNEKSQVNIIHETGTVGWATKKVAKRVLINDIDVTKEVKQNGDFYTVSITEQNKNEVLILEW